MTALRPQSGTTVWRVVWRDTSASVGESDRQRGASFTYQRDADEFADHLRFRTQTGSPTITQIHTVETVVDDMLGRVDQERGRVA